jgi:hypothetical protein
LAQRFLIALLYVPGERRREVAGGVTMALMALTPLKVGARLRGRIKEGEMMAGW